MNSGHVNILGAGLCGSLLGVLLARRGYAVTIRELRADPRKTRVAAGRSINLALSARGIRGLRHAGIYHRVAPLLMPMQGRLIHGLDGSCDLLPYGQRDYEFINSVSRAELNKLLIETAEREHGVEFLFEHAVRAYDRDTAKVSIESPGGNYTLAADALISADGAGSVIRRSYNESGRIGPNEDLLSHGYKELTIPPRARGGFEMEHDALHIWPRGDFMLIALPNPPGDFTLTLFMPNEGETSFASLDTRARIGAFFEEYFPDVITLIPDVVDMYQRNPVGMLGTIRCRHWHDGDRFLLIGDAAHAVVPFHGQGMNLAFEDCVVLDNILDRGETAWDRVFELLEREQLANANAIADMALENYVEMRDTVRDPKFALRKALSFELERRMPDRFIPRYSMVMFHDEIPYAVAQSRGRIQSELLEALTRDVNRLDQVDLGAAERLARQKLPPL